MNPKPKPEHFDDGVFDEGYLEALLDWKLTQLPEARKLRIWPNTAWAAMIIVGLGLFTYHCTNHWESRPYQPEARIGMAAAVMLTTAGALGLSIELVRRKR